MATSQEILDKLNKCKAPWHCSKKELPPLNTLILCAYYTGESSNMNHLKGYKLVISYRYTLKNDAGIEKDLWLVFPFINNLSNANNYSDARIFSNTCCFETDKETTDSFLKTTDKCPGQANGEQNIVTANNFGVYFTCFKPCSVPNYWMFIPDIK